MRAVMLLAIAACLASPFTTTASQAATLRPPGIETQSNSIVEVAGPRCGRGYHWVQRHRARNGHWIKGHCTRNRRYR